MSNYFILLLLLLLFYNYYYIILSIIICILRIHQVCKNPQETRLIVGLVVLHSGDLCLVLCLLLAHLLAPVPQAIVGVFEALVCSMGLSEEFLVAIFSIIIFVFLTLCLNYVYIYHFRLLLLLFIIICFSFYIF